MEEENIFLANRSKITLEDYLGYNCSGRGNLGEDVPVFVYRMLEYSLKEILSETYGKDVQVELFRRAGFKAGTFFARKVLDTGLEFNAFVAQLQQSRIYEFVEIVFLFIDKINKAYRKLKKLFCILVPFMLLSLKIQ